VSGSFSYPRTPSKNPRQFGELIALRTARKISQMRHAPAVRYSELGISALASASLAA
jgi:hypothetical protein